MLTRILTGVLDFLVPPRHSETLLRACTLRELQSLQQKDGLPYHDPSVTALIWELKYHGSVRAAALGGALLRDELLAIAEEELGVPLLIPVPMHAARRRARGHNQTEVLCQAALAGLGGGYDYCPAALHRITNTAPQQGLERQKRLINVEGSMAANRAQTEGRVCVVVDDVTTTGATLAEAKRALFAGGARRVYTLALARA